MYVGGGVLKRVQKLSIPILIALFNVFLIFHAAEMVAAAKDGVQLWFNQVLPALLPFAVGANLLAGLGFIRLLGIIMAPIMIPVFNVSGAGAFALLTGLTSGYPMGAKAVAHLRETGQIGKREAQRLIAFTNNAGPLFVIGFVGTGLFGSTLAGYGLLLSHIAGAVFVGILFRFLWPSEPAQKYSPPQNSDVAESFGQVLGNSIKNAMESMTLVGGYIILFCVVIKALELSGFFGLLGIFVNESQVPIVTGFAAGVLEVANGAKILTQGGEVTRATLSTAATIISFGGFSVHAQTAHFIKQTDIRFGLYLLAKCLQAIVAGIICWHIAPWFLPQLHGEVPVTLMWQENFFVDRFARASIDFILIVGSMLVGAKLIGFWIRVRSQ